MWIWISYGIWRMACYIFHFSRCPTSSCHLHHPVIQWVIQGPGPGCIQQTTTSNIQYQYCVLLPVSGAGGWWYCVLRIGAHCLPGAPWSWSCTYPYPPRGVGCGGRRPPSVIPTNRAAGREVFAPAARGRVGGPEVHLVAGQWVCLPNKALTCCLRSSFP
jgi:hypothetical protein